MLPITNNDVCLVAPLTTNNESTPPYLPRCNNAICRAFNNLSFYKKMVYLTLSSISLGIVLLSTAKAGSPQAITGTTLILGPMAIWTIIGILACVGEICEGIGKCIENDGLHRSGPSYQISGQQHPANSSSPITHYNQIAQYQQRQLRQQQNQSQQRLHQSERTRLNFQLRQAAYHQEQQRRMFK